MTRSLSILTLVSAVFFGCDRELTSSAPSGPSARAAPSVSGKPPIAESSDVPPFIGTAGVVEKTVPSGVAELVAVRSGRHAGFVRTVFEFSPALFPGYHLEYIDEPVRRCGSGEVTGVAGDAWLQVRLSPAKAHDESGKPTALPLERKPRLGVLQEVESTCDFEAVVTWVLGVASPNRYRVLELSSPPRLAVDILDG